MGHWVAPGSGQSSLSVYTVPAAPAHPGLGLQWGLPWLLVRGYLPLFRVTWWRASPGLRLLLFSVQVTSGPHLSPSATRSICRSPEPHVACCTPMPGLSISRPAFAQENSASDSRRGWDASGSTGGKAALASGRPGQGFGDICRGKELRTPSILRRQCRLTLQS